MGAMVFVHSVAQSPAPAGPGSCAPVKPTALEDDQAVMNAATTVAKQMIGVRMFDNSNSSAPPSIQQNWAAFNLAVLQEMQPACQLDKAVQNAVTAQAVSSQTDKQVTAPSAQAGGTSVVQKVGLPQLLGFAVENGAIANNVSGTTMTLSTTPYAFFSAFGARATQQTYNASGWFAHNTGVSATFNVGSASSLLASATRKQVSQWQVKATFRDSSIRSARVEPLFDNSDLKKSMDTYAGDFSDSALQILGPELNTPADKAYQAAWAAKFQSDVDAAIQAHDMARSSAIGLTLLKILDKNADYQRGLKIASTQLLNRGSLSSIVNKLRADQADFATKEAAFEKVIADLPRGWNGDLAFSQQFPATVNASGSTGSAAAAPAIPVYFKGELDLTCEPKASSADTGVPCPLRSSGTFTFNASAMFYPNPVAALHEKTFRGVQAALEGQWTLGPGFVHVKQANDDSRMTLSLSGNYQRLQENKDQKGKRPDIAIGNVNLSIPISSGVAIPLSFTVATAGEQINQSYVHGNFGLTFDLDKLAALLKANQ